MSRSLHTVIAAAVVIAGCTTQTTTPTSPSNPSLPTPTVSTTAAPGTGSTTEPPSIEGLERVAVGDDLAAMVDAAEPGTGFYLETGVHRLHQVLPKDGMTFIGAPGAVMSGAVVVDGFVAEGRHWRAAGLERSGRDAGECVTGYEGCRLSQDIFMDDVMLWQVTSGDDLGPGRWMWDGDGVVVADDPSQRRVELSMAAHAFISAAADVTIRGITVEKYATPAQRGAIQAQEGGEGERGRGWLIEDVEARLNHGAGIRTGDGTVVRNARLHHNGQLGITVSGGTDVLIEDTIISHNNIAGFRWGWEAGGMKATRTTGLTVRRVASHDNLGPGLWTDIDCLDTLYEENTVTDNSGPGIYHEISYDAVIRNNVVEGNGFDKPGWVFGAGIVIAASSGVEVYGNTVRGNVDGIVGIQQDRGEGAFGPRLVADLWVHDNEISVNGGHIGIVQDVGDDSVFTDRNNRFERNTYVGVTGASYAWMNEFIDRGQWVANGQDVDGTWV